MIDYNNELLIAIGDMRIKQFDYNGNLIGLFTQLDGDGDINSLISMDEQIIGHGSASGYRIYTHIIEPSGSSTKKSSLQLAKNTARHDTLIKFL